MPGVEPELVTIDVAAARLGVHPQTVRRWVADPAVPLTGYRLGPRLLRLRVRDVDELARELPGTRRTQRRPRKR